MTVAAAGELDGGTMDCGSGLLLLLMRTMRTIATGEVLLVRTEEPSVPPDLRDWARLAGHEIVSIAADSPAGPWRVGVRRDGGRAPTPAAFTQGSATPVGERLWIYANFHCNLACPYCCAQSAPSAAPRSLPVALAAEAAEEFRDLGGRELYLTGGEPFLHPQIAALGTELARHLPTTILTNAMVFARGARRAALEALPRERVRLQISLDSAGPDLHDRHRGAGSHAKALAGIALARELGFTVRVAATLYPEEIDAATDLTGLLADLGVAEQDRLIRPVAAQGFAETGTRVGLDDLHPEPTLSVDGIWWHPVAIADPGMQVATAPLPLQPALDTIRDTLAVQNAAQREGRQVFRCA
ncbi:MAG: radical SAM protein [Sporichthyaceae bacterium]